MRDYDLYIQRASEARADADAAKLDNVRDRCLRAEAAWKAMADRAARTENMRATLEAHKAAAAAAACRSRRRSRLHRRREIGLVRRRRLNLA